MDIPKYNQSTYIGFLKMKKGGMKIIPGEKDDLIIKIEDKMFIYITGVKTLAFSNTYIPKYLTHNKKYRSSDVNDLEISKYDKYSIGGLIKIIEGLELDINLVEEFKLNDINYDNIITYEDMLTKIDLLNN